MQWTFFLFHLKEIVCKRICFMSNWLHNISLEAAICSTVSFSFLLYTGRKKAALLSRLYQIYTQLLRVLWNFSEIVLVKLEKNVSLRKKFSDTQNLSGEQCSYTCHKFLSLVCPWSRYPLAGSDASDMICVPGRPGAGCTGQGTRGRGQCWTMQDLSD